eukprot:SM000108S14242  [mRNA]  locus=s108:432425:435171:- [translate_table: standard]
MSARAARAGSPPWPRSSLFYPSRSFSSRILLLTSARGRQCGLPHWRAAARSRQAIMGAAAAALAGAARRSGPGPMVAPVEDAGRGAAAALHGRHFNVFSVFSKEAKMKEREKLCSSRQDELNRGYFDDFKELRKTHGKLHATPMAPVPATTARLFPSLSVFRGDGVPVAIPTSSSSGPAVTLVCLSFRANSQEMVSSWLVPFAARTRNPGDAEYYEVSVIESPVLSLPFIRPLLLRSMRRPQRRSTAVSQDQQLPQAAARGQEASSSQPVADTTVQPQVVYLFGDTWQLRKDLDIKNRLTGHIFLVDAEHRLRWRATGMATADELQLLHQCAEEISKERRSKTSPKLIRGREATQ